MSRIALVLACNTHWAPYMHRYIRELDNANKEYVLIYWNRENITENLPCETKVFNAIDEIGRHGWKKPFYFLEFAQFVKKELAKEQYEKVVFLGTYACVPAIISGFLKRKYKGKYWIDIRDLTYEENGLFNRLQAKAIINSYKTVVSSKGFESYLPVYNYGHIHNIDTNIEIMARKLHKIDDDKIRISYIGNVGFYEECQKFIDYFANDNRFVLGFYGAGSEVLETYCKEKMITNIKFAGRFERERTVDFYNITDIIYNNYGNQGINLRTALSNKLYYAMRFDYPILVSENTYMEEISKEQGLGFTVKYTKDLPDRLYKWYMSRNDNSSKQKFKWSDIVKEDCNAISDFISFIK